MKFSSIAVGVLLASGAVAAQAAPYEFAMPLAPQFPFGAFVPVSGPTFADTWAFEAPATAATVSGSAISVDITPSFNIDNIKIELFSGEVGGGGSLVAQGSAGESSKLTDISVSAGADYYFKVSGNTGGASSGFYAFTAVSAVPEPETYAMMLAGLGVLGFLASRRRRED